MILVGSADPTILSMIKEEQMLLNFEWSLCLYEFRIIIFIDDAELYNVHFGIKSVHYRVGFLIHPHFI